MQREFPPLSRRTLLLSGAMAIAQLGIAHGQQRTGADIMTQSPGNPFSEAGNIPVGPRTPYSSYTPLILDVPGRPVPLEVKVSMPATGSNLPVILLSHGHGGSNFLSSYRGYGPLADFWAAHGFIVIQPTHLDSKALGLRETQLPDAPFFWRDRATDMRFLLDHLKEIEGAVPGLAGRMDHDRVAAVGHSLGGATVGMLMGAQVLDPNDPREKDLSDPRVKAGVMIGAPGVADPETSSAAAARGPALRYADFANMRGTTLVVAGDKDLNPGFSTRVSYRSDAYVHSPSGNKTLLTFLGAQHIFGGISGYDAAETSDENPERVATLCALIWAYLRSQLYPGDTAWRDAVAALETTSPPVATIETR